MNDSPGKRLGKVVLVEVGHAQLVVPPQRVVAWRAPNVVREEIDVGVEVIEVGLVGETPVDVLVVDGALNQRIVVGTQQRILEQIVERRAIDVWSGRAGFVLRVIVPPKEKCGFMLVKTDHDGRRELGRGIPVFR